MSRGADAAQGHAGKRRTGPARGTQGERARRAWGAEAPGQKVSRGRGCGARGACSEPPAT